MRATPFVRCAPFVLSVAAPLHPFVLSVAAPQAPRSRRTRSRRTGLLALAVALLAACGDTLVDHGGVGILTSASTCDDGQVTCSGVCTTQTPLKCGSTCSPCPTAPANATESCTPVGAGGHDGVCGYTCDAGLLRCATGCCAPALVAAGGEFSCAATSGGDGGEVHCFGAGDVGQLGNGVAGDRATSAVLRGFPAAVTGLVAGGAHACAIVGSETRCWGNGAAFGVSGSVLDPVIVPALGSATALAAGKTHTCAIVGTQVVCVGTDAFSGGGSPALGGTPLEISAGDRFSCAVVNTASGNVVQCWGADDFGQLGGGVAGSPLATPVTVGTGVIATSVGHLAAGARHACAGTETPSSNSALWCWGSNATRQLGADPVTLGIFGPTLNTRVKKGVLALSGGDQASCAMESDPGGGGNVLSCWSSNALVSGGTTTGEPAQVLASTASYRFSAGALHTCFVDPRLTPARLQCFGTGARGRLGNGATADSTTPVLVLDR